MYLTPYTVLPSGLDSMDPLGFLRPYAALTDALLPEFTTVTVAPACHSFLCWAVRFLSRRHLSVKDREFARSMRDLEVLWGVLCLRASRPEGVLNITKLNRLPQKKPTRAVARKAEFGLYANPGYGVRGHYAGPSVTWGFLDADLNLTSSGEALAEAWDTRLPPNGRRGRKRPTFTTLAEAWMNDEPVPDAALNEEDCLCWSVAEGVPNEREKFVWKRAFSRAAELWPAGRGLWTQPPDAKVKALYAANRFAFFPALRLHYEARNSAGRFDELLRCLERCRAFEQFAALVQFIFEWEYLRRQRQGSEEPLPPHRLTGKVLRRAAREAADCLEGSGLDWDLPSRLCLDDSFETQVSVIIAAHTAHQKRKLAQPFMDEHTVLLTDRVQNSPVMRLAEKLADADETRLCRGVMNAYPRSWFFNNVWRWLDYAGESHGHAD